MDNSSPKIYTEFLPISRADMEARGWEQLDFVVVGGDAYVDHPSFGTAIISRLLEAEGYKIGVLAQPRYTDCEDFKRFGKPKYGFFIGGGNVDSMVSHYSVAKIPRAEDEYSPGGKGGARPDRSATVYTKLAKEAYPDLPVILGGLEASLRRFAHYDYWLDTVLPSIAEDSGADIISYGMGEHQTVEIARRLAAGEPVESITDVAEFFSRNSPRRFHSPRAVSSFIYLLFVFYFSLFLKKDRFLFLLHIFRLLPVHPPDRSSVPVGFLYQVPGDAQACCHPERLHQIRIPVQSFQLSRKILLLLLSP